MKNTDDNVLWLSHPAADELRVIYQKNAKLSIEALLSAAMESTDAKVRGHVMAYRTWQAAYGELGKKNESD